MNDSRINRLDEHFHIWKQKHFDEVSDYKNNKKDCYLKNYDNKKRDLYKLNIQESFTIDGIVDEEAWEGGEKILFILKEANLGEKLSKTKDGELCVADDGKFWFQDCVKRDYEGEEKIDWRRGIFRRLKKIGIAKKVEIAKKTGITYVDNSFSLLSTAYMNINKRGGLGYAREDIINSYYREYKDDILKEIRIIEPQIVAICCGNQDYAKDLKEEINKTDWGKNVKVEMYYHPAMRWIKDEEYVKPIG